MGERTYATLSWHQGLAFVARSGSGHAVLMDSPSRPHHLGSSPMELMLAGLGGCTAMDVVAILGKMRVQLSSCQVEVTAERSESNPKYFRQVEIVYRLRGKGITKAQVERAVTLSHSTYCSALASLREDCRVLHRIELEEEGEERANCEGGTSSTSPNEAAR